MYTHTRSEKSRAKFKGWWFAEHPNLQVLLVTGGYDRQRLSSTEVSFECGNRHVSAKLTNDKFQFLPPKFWEYWDQIPRGEAPSMSIISVRGICFHVSRYPPQLRPSTYPMALPLEVLGLFLDPLSSVLRVLWATLSQMICAPLHAYPKYEA